MTDGGNMLGRITRVYFIKKLDINNYIIGLTNLNPN